MDWHFRIHQRINDSERRGQHRSWFVDELVSEFIPKCFCFANHIHRTGSSHANHSTKKPSMLATKMPGAATTTLQHLASLNSSISPFQTIRILPTASAQSVRKSLSPPGTTKRKSLSGWTHAKSATRSTTQAVSQKPRKMAAKATTDFPGLTRQLSRASWASEKRSMRKTRNQRPRLSSNREALG